MGLLDPGELHQRLEAVDPVEVRGSLHHSRGLGLRAELPGARRGDWVRIERRGATPLDAEVVGFDRQEVLLMPFGDARGTAPGDRVRSLGRPLSIPCSEALLGRVLDGLGQPLDGGPPIEAPAWAVRRPPPAPLERAPIDTPFVTGVRALDALCTLGHGQRAGLLAGSGAGKTSLLGQLVRQAPVDRCVVALIGERGRELRGWVDALPPLVRERTVVVCATADTPALVRMESAHVATAIAEYFRAQGQRVLLAMDSLTRFARAAREVALATGETATRRGYPASAFAELPALLERAGNDGRGSLTAVYSVLVEGEDLDDPVADEVRGLLDGHLVLRRRLLERGRLPPLDPLSSLSRVMDALVERPHAEAARRVRGWLAHYESKRELVELGAYERGSDPLLDQALRKLPAVEALLGQDSQDAAAFLDTLHALQRLDEHPTG